MGKGREITIYDIANELNISSATVSRALKDDPAVSLKTRKKIFETAEKMGYRSNFYARNLRRKHTNTIGFMVHELRSNFINSVLAGVEQVTAAAGYDLIIAHSVESYEREAANARNFFDKRVDGLIASLSFDTKGLEHFRPFVQRDVPVIFFDRVEKSMESTVVVIDNYRAGYQATRHLIEQGCRRIMHVTANLSRNVYEERYKGYRAALAEHGLAYEDGWLVVGDLSEKSGTEAARVIMASDPRPDGAFITNDFVAAVCMRTLKGHQLRIPGDIAIVGFNNDIISELVEPALTTVNYPGKEMGMVAAETLVNHLKGRDNLSRINTIVLSSELIIRGSSFRK